MKGRVTYEQLNAAVNNINTAVKAKYKILHQPLKGLNNHSRKLQARFREQETKDTRGRSDVLPEAPRLHHLRPSVTLTPFAGQHFVVEDDIRELAQIKVDKRFQGIFNMLRHCQRLRELRGGGVTRYVLM